MKYWWVILVVYLLWILLTSWRRKRPLSPKGGSASEPPQPYPPSAAAKRRSRKRIATSYVPGIPSDFQLTPEFSKAFDLMENSKQHLFITGNAGTGKSTLLQYFKEKTKRKIVVVAPTGIAAINVGGSTIHSFFRFPPRLVTPSDVRR